MQLSFICGSYERFIMWIVITLSFRPIISDRSFVLFSVFIHYISYDALYPNILSEILKKQ